MKPLFEYLSARVKQSIIHATNDTIKDIVNKELERLGNKADLNYIDVGKVTNFACLFEDKDFQGDVSEWNMSNAEDAEYMFYNCSYFDCDISNRRLDNIKNAYKTFFNCTSLTKSPRLTATTLSPNCYQYMFYNCVSLRKAPDLPATKLSNGCYDSMFYGCTSLESLGIIKAKNWKDEKYSEDMLKYTPLQNKF